MDPKVVTRLTTYADQKTGLNANQRNEINEILKELVERCKGLGREEGVAGGGGDGTLNVGDPQVFRESIPYSVFEALSTLGDYWFLTLDSDYTYELFSNICRFGRNATITSKRNQDYMSESGLAAISVIILQEEAPKMCDRQAKLSETDLMLIRLALQMACNCMVCNVEVAQKLAIPYHFYDTILNIFASFEDERTRQYTAMTGYTMVDLLGYGADVNISMAGRFDILEIIMDNLNETPYKLWFSALVSSETFIPAVYAQIELGQESRVRVLRNITTYEIPLEDESLVYVRDVFKTIARVAVNSDLTKADDMITEELSALVALLTHICSDLEGPRVNILLQNDATFVSLANQLLKTVHEAGKHSQNSLTPLEKIEDVQKSMAGGDIASGPTYMFKSNLIRLIGNLSYKHKPNQTTALDLQTLPIILECTKIDGRNPFAPQCAIFALKLLLEDNLGNQNFVAQMNKISKVVQ